MNSYSLQRTLESILRTREHELTCEEVARLLDRYVDQRLAGAVDDSPEMRLVEEHHKICPECQEEYEGIVRALRNCD
jgi:predicted anti-sigma-YlaC factor YlaD